MDVLYPYCAGIDVHKKTISVCVLTPGAQSKPQPQIREFGTRACKVVGWSGRSGHIGSLYLRPKASMPMPEGVFQGAVEHMNPYVQELLDRIPVPPHLLLLRHPFGDNLVDGGFGKSGRDSQPSTVALAVVG